MNKIIFIDGFDSVRDAETQSIEIFSTIFPKDLSELISRTEIPVDVVDAVVIIYNEKGLSEVDTYLLTEEEITQDEREIIIESLFNWSNQ